MKIPEQIALHETQLVLHRLMCRMRQAINKDNLTHKDVCQKAVDDAVYILGKYSDPNDALRIVQSDD